MKIFLYKVPSKSLSYLLDTIPNGNTQHDTRNSGNIHSFFVKNDYLQNYFFECVIADSGYTSKADSFDAFKKRILSFIRPMSDSICNIHNPLGVKYLTRLRITFSHLKGHKIKHHFHDGKLESGSETTIHFFLQCASFNNQSFFIYSF